MNGVDLGAVPAVAGQAVASLSHQTKVKSDADLSAWISAFPLSLLTSD